ncbi:DUF2452 domain-containing protein [Roseibacillus ishigakijimensis]|uniref:DUF2452 domain-containing protein n=2 Tax=Roseibacillus ishigakijimensis TaxID=454146 RepID=A0A934RNX9_9BACT|nr:hypothetical protein [Roseibacillus ishigakijimensis]
MTEPTRDQSAVPGIGSDEKPSKAFLPYPASTLSPTIIPTDLSSFKSRGIARVERDLQQKLTEMREEYIATITHFNWNKLAYEADISFEPVVGEIYHLYEANGRHLLSLIEPEKWHQKHLASLRLNVDRQFELIRRGEGIDERQLFGEASP